MRSQHFSSHPRTYVSYVYCLIKVLNQKYQKRYNGCQRALFNFTLLKRWKQASKYNLNSAL